MEPLTRAEYEALRSQGFTDEQIAAEGYTIPGAGGIDPLLARGEAADASRGLGAKTGRDIRATARAGNIEGTKGVLANAAQGASLGFADDLPLIGDTVKEHAERLQATNPAIAGAAQVAGGLVVPGMAATKATRMMAPAGAGILRRALANAVAGGVTSGLAGAGYAEGDLGDRAKAAVAPGVAGAILSGGISGAIDTGGAIKRAIGKGGPLRKAYQVARSLKDISSGRPLAGMRGVKTLKDLLDESLSSVDDVAGLADDVASGPSWTPKSEEYMKPVKGRTVRGPRFEGQAAIGKLQRAAEPNLSGSFDDLARSPHPDVAEGLDVIAKVPKESPAAAAEFAARKQRGASRARLRDDEVRLGLPQVTPEPPQGIPPELNPNDPANLWLQLQASVDKLKRGEGVGSLRPKGEAPPTGLLGKVKATLGDESGRIGPLYHGSPHKFDKFDVSKIGTGEGAQAYGHGLYFAESPGVAKAYQEALAGKPKTIRRLVVDANELSPGQIAKLQRERGELGDLLRTINPKGRKLQPQAVVDAAVAKAADFEAQAAKWRGRLTAYEASPPLASTYGPDDFRGFAESAERAAKELRDFVDRVIVKETRTTPGALYTAELPTAHPDDFLDWDKPLSQQSEKVRKALEGSGVTGRQFYIRGTRPGSGYANVADAGSPEAAERIAQQFRDQGFHDVAIEDVTETLPTLSGQDAYKKLMAGVDAPANRGRVQSLATERLRKAGIRGIRYKDAGSRGAEGGTHNYVVFDDADISILSREGKAALQMLGLTGATAGAGLTAAALAQRRRASKP